MDASLHETIFALTETLLNIIEVVQVSIPNGFLNCIHPFFLFSFGSQVIDSPFVREDQHEWVKNGLGV